MFIALNRTFESINERDWDKNPKLCVDDTGVVAIVSLKTDNFELKFDNGKAMMRLERRMDADEARKLGQALIDVADSLDKTRAEWEKPSEVEKKPRSKQAGKR